MQMTPTSCPLAAMYRCEYAGLRASNFCCSAVDGTLFILKDEVVTANDHALAAHAACNAVGHDVLHLGVHLLMGNAALFGGTHHGVGHGMGKVLFQTGGQLQNFALVAAGEGHDLHYLRGGTGEGAGLVEHDSVG